MKFRPTGAWCVQPRAVHTWPILMLVWLCTLGLSAEAGAWQADPDTLVLASYSDLFEAVAQNNQVLTATSSSAAAQAALTDAAGTFPDPSLMAGLSPFPVHTARGEQVFQLRVEQMVPWPGKRSLQRKMAELDAILGYEAPNRILSDLIFEAVHAGLAIQHAEATMELVAAYQKRLERFEQVAITRYETGEGEQQSIWKLQLAIAAQDQRMLQLEEDRDAAYRRLEHVVHRPVYVVPGAFESAAPATPGADVRNLSAHRELELSLERARLARDISRLSDRPDMGISVTWMAMQESSIPASSDGRDAFALGVMVRLPIGRAKQRAREQHATIQEETIRLRMAAFEATWLASRNEQQERLDGQLARQRHLNERLLPVAESMLASTFRSYSSGAGSFLDLLDAERTAFELKLQNVEISTLLNTTRWTLQRLAGYLESAALTASIR